MYKGYCNTWNMKVFRLVYPKQEFLVRKVILEALRKNTSAEKGVGYNLLFDKVKDRVRSKATFDNYLTDLEHDGYVTKEDDPRHKKGVVIYRIPNASELELLTIQMIRNILDLFQRSKSDRRKTIKSMEYDEDTFGEIDNASRWNLNAVVNCIFLSQKTVAKMLPKLKELYGETPFIKALEKNRKIHLQFKSSQS